MSVYHLVVRNSSLRKLEKPLINRAAQVVRFISSMRSILEVNLMTSGWRLVLKKHSQALVFPPCAPSNKRNNKKVLENDKNPVNVGPYEHFFTNQYGCINKAASKSSGVLQQQQRVAWVSTLCNSMKNCCTFINHHGGFTITG